MLHYIGYITLYICYITVITFQYLYVTLQSLHYIIDMLLYSRRSLPLGGVSNAELTEHYADCIKLSAENVRVVIFITRNFFHLIIIQSCSEAFPSCRK